MISKLYLIMKRVCSVMPQGCIECFMSLLIYVFDAPNFHISMDTLLEEQLG